MQDRIKELRKSLGLTQKDFGERLGVQANTITSYESGVRTPLIVGGQFQRLDSQLSLCL